MGENQNCKFLRGHLVMSMRQGRGGDLCNRGDPPSNMTAHRYQPSPNIKWTRLPFSHEHKSFPKPSTLSMCVCRNAPVGFREAEERQFVRARGPPHFTDTGQGAPPETDGRPPLTPLHGMALLPKNLKVGVWWLKANVIHTNNSCQNLCYLYLGHDFEKTHTLSALPKLYHLL